MTAIDRFKLHMLATTLRKFAENPLCYDVPTCEFNSSCDHNPSCMNRPVENKELLGVLRGDSNEAPYGALNTLVQLYDGIFNPSTQYLPSVAVTREIADYWCDILSSWKAHPSVENKKARDFALSMASELSGFAELGKALWFEDESLSIMVLGDLYVKIDPTAYCLIKILAKISPRPINTRQILSTIKDGAVPLDVGLGPDSQLPFVKCLNPLPENEGSADKTFDRALSNPELPPELRALIHSKRNKGRYLTPPHG